MWTNHNKPALKLRRKHMDIKETIGKALRSLRRDYFNTWNRDSKPYSGIKPFVLGGGGALCVFAGTFALVFGSPLVMIGACAGVMSACSIGGIIKRRFDMNRYEQGSLHDQNESRLPHYNPISLVGPGRDVCLLINTQRLIEDFTRNARRDEQLPEEIVRKLEPYLKDAAEAAARVNTFNALSQPVAAIEFQRTLYDAHGQIVAETVAQTRPANASIPAAQNPSSASAGTTTAPIILKPLPQIRKRQGKS